MWPNLSLSGAHHGHACKCSAYDLTRRPAATLITAAQETHEAGHAAKLVAAVAVVQAVRNGYGYAEQQEFRCAVRCAVELESALGMMQSCCEAGGCTHESKSGTISTARRE